MAVARSVTVTGGDKAPIVNAVVWAESSVTIFLLVFRLISRYRNGKLGSDDWWMLLATMSFVTLSAIVTWYGSIGGFKHEMEALEDGASLDTIIKGTYAMLVFAIFTFGPPKTSLGMLVSRIMQTVANRRAHRMRIFTIATLIWLWLSIIVCIILTLVQCSPLSDLWDYTKPDSEKHCWGQSFIRGVAIYSSSVNIATDLLIAFLPIIVVYKLPMNPRKKVALSLMTCYGVAAAAFGAVKITYIKEIFNRNDVTWAIYGLVIWTMSEIFIIIAFGSIPPVYLFFAQWLIRKDYVERREAKLKFTRNSRFSAWAYSRTSQQADLKAETSTQSLSSVPSGGPRRAQSDEVITVQTQINITSENNRSQLDWF